MNAGLSTYFFKAHFPMTSCGDVSPNHEALGRIANAPEKKSTPVIETVSDEHLGMLNRAAFMYWRRAQSAAPIQFHIGDSYDAWAGEPLSLMDIVYMDLCNWRGQLDGQIDVQIPGNHDDRALSPLIAGRGREAGYNIFPAAIVEHDNGGRTLLLHGHQFDSEKLINTIQHTTSEEYERALTENPAAAAFMKWATKQFLQAMNYNPSYLFAARKYDVNRLIIGHRHTPVQEIIFSNGLSENSSFAQRRNAMFMRALIDHLPAHLPALTNFFRRNDSFLRWVFEKRAGRDVAQMVNNVLDYLKTDPDLGFLTAIKGSDLKPFYNGKKIPPQWPAGGKKNRVRR